MFGNTEIKLSLFFTWLHWCYRWSAYIAIITSDKQVQYIRKGVPTENVIALWSFNMQFIFVIASFPGIFHDSYMFERVINDKTYDHYKKCQYSNGKSDGKSV